jgi:hypothetical protein
MPKRHMKHEKEENGVVYKCLKRPRMNGDCRTPGSLMLSQDREIDRGGKIWVCLMSHTITLLTSLSRSK